MYLLPENVCVCALAPVPEQLCGGADVAAAYRALVAVETGVSRQTDAACARQALEPRTQGATVPVAPSHLPRQTEINREQDERSCTKL